MKRSHTLLLIAISAWYLHVEARSAEWTLSLSDDGDGDVNNLGRHLSGTKKPSYYAVETDDDEGAQIVSTFKSALTNRSAFAGSGRIAYGDAAALGQFPTVVYLSVGEYMCTGTVIAARAILTAAHCVRTKQGEWIKRSDVKVYFGSNVLKQTKSYPINQLITPKYNAKSNYGDIALIRLATPIYPSGFGYTTLGDANTQLPPKIAVVGWGEMESQNNPDVLMYTYLSTMTQARCNTVHRAILGNLPPPGSICFGLDVNPYTASCPGDSGGPYFITTGQPNVQIAVVSYGPDIVCGATNNNLDVGTSVLYWRKWIDAQLARFQMT